MVRHIVILMMVGLMGVSVLQAQPQKGSIELSTSASFYSIKYDGGEETLTWLHIPVRVGYFVTRGLEIEPELIFGKMKEEKAGWLFSINLGYNFVPTDPGQRIVPYLFAGVGIANTLPIQEIASFGIEDLTMTVFNVGLGVKAFVSSKAALRMGYRLQRSSGERGETYFGTTYEEDYSSWIHHFFAGVSVFLK